jgi:hypothetical protein
MAGISRPLIREGGLMSTPYVTSSGIQADRVVLVDAAGAPLIGASGATVDVASIAAGDNNIGNVDVASIAAGTNNIGRVGASAFEITGTIDGTNIIAAAGNYAAGDVVSNDADAGEGDPWIFTGIARESGGSGTITKATLECSEDSVVARVRLWLFNAVPTTTEMDDNEAFNYDADDAGKFIGWITFPALVDAGEVSVAFTKDGDLPLPFKCVGSANLWGITQFLDAETNETASMTFRLKLMGIQD